MEKIGFYELLLLPKEWVQLAEEHVDLLRMVLLELSDLLSRQGARRRRRGRTQQRE